MVPVIVSLAKTHVVATWRNVVIQIWEHELHPADQLVALLKTKAAFAALKAQLTGRPLLAIAVVSETTNMPDSAAREVAKTFPEYFDFYVGVHEGTGFRASLVRAVIAGLVLASRKRVASEICSNVDDGAATLAAHSADTLNGGELAAVVHELRRRIADVA